MKLILKKSTLFLPKGNGKKILMVIFWYTFAWMLVGYLNAPKVIVYFGDLINLWVFINALVYKKVYNMHLVDLPLIFMILFSVIGCISAMLNLESPLLLGWGLRNNVRFFLFYYACITFLTERHFNYFIKAVGTLFWISLPLCIFEKYFISYDVGTIVGDWVGGIYFGFQGVTHPFNILLVIYSSDIAIRYFDKKCKTSKFVLTIGTAMIMSAMAELKVFIVEITIIMIIVTILKNISWKTLFLYMVGTLAMSVLITLFVSMNGQGKSYYTAELFTVKSMLEIVTRDTGYNGNGDLNRFSGIYMLMKYYMQNNPIIILFGIGLGNADYSNYSMFTSDFYVKHSLLHYQWFSALFVFLETGIIGLFSYLMVFISALFQGIRRLKGQAYDITFYVIMVIIMILMIFYGVSMRSEQSGFILYMILALPTALQREVCLRRRKNDS